ncbi:MAG TPA: hypothetical protein VMG12_41820 [Polyangiaceae bacterium]|nr:hypothetical protein [Polyangiaceae bacterium]
MTASSVLFWSNLEAFKEGGAGAAVALEQLHLQIYRWASRHISSFGYYYPAGSTTDDVLQSYMVEILQRLRIHALDRTRGSARAFFKKYARRFCWKLIPEDGVGPTRPLDDGDKADCCSPERQLQQKQRLQRISHRVLQLADRTEDPMAFALALEVALQFDRHEHLPQAVIERVLLADISLGRFRTRLSRLRTDLESIVAELDVKDSALPKR